MKTEIDVIEKPDLENPILIEGLPGIGNVGRIAAEYLINQLEAKKFAELYSPHFMPFVLIHDKEISLLKCDFYYWKNPDGNDFIFLTGDAQAQDKEGGGHFEVSNKIIDFCEEMNVEKIFTLGGFGTGKIQDEVENGTDVFGITTDETLEEKYSDYNINFKDTSSRIGMIVGATGLLLGIAKKRGIEGVCLMGETAGFPIVTDPKAAEEVIKVLVEIFDLDIGLEDIEGKVEEMEEFLEKLEKVQKKALKSAKDKESEGDKLRYIG
ncbi:MAG: proteasome assembly chaperone family protein [Candidatus Aenigmatarchaeota archaeon]